MKTLYLECSMGAAGDMLAAALLELHPAPGRVIETLNRAGIPQVKIEAVPAVKCGITGTHFSVTVNGQSEASRDADPAECACANIHSHGEHAHDHAGHAHAYDDHEHCEHGHGGHDHSHDGHSHCHGEHAHEHSEHTHEHGEHEHDEHDHCGHGHGGHEHSHCHGEHTHEHGEHTHKHSHGSHEHRHLSDITALINGLSLPAPVRENMLAVYTIIAEAESQAHGCPIEHIHFHEVGTMDAVADIAAVCLLIHELAPERIAASPVHVGSGQVHCAHGILPVPAPATAHLLRGIPSYGGQVRGELCTPTGAALLRHFAQSFGPQPLLQVEKIGYGMGQKDFPQANCLRALLGEDANLNESSADRTDSGMQRDTVIELSCNLDDMTPEEIGFAIDRLWEAGALDVFTVNIGMKKNRPGVMLSCLCREEQREELTRLFFLHTSTLGVRETEHKRSVLRRTTENRESAYGAVRVKKSQGCGVQREKIEYDDLAAIARSQQLPLRQARKLLQD